MDSYELAGVRLHATNTNIREQGTFRPSSGLAGDSVHSTQRMCAASWFWKPTSWQISQASLKSSLRFAKLDLGGPDWVDVALRVVPPCDHPPVLYAGISLTPFVVGNGIAVLYEQEMRYLIAWLLGVPVERTRFFAGEATNTSGHGGTSHGAIASGLTGGDAGIEARWIAYS